MTIFAGLLLLGCMTVGPALGEARPGFYEINKRRAFDLGDNEVFGSSVAIEGGTMVVGATGSDYGAYKAGSAYIITSVPHDPSIRNQLKIHSTDPHTWDRFGTAAAMDGDRMVIGAPQSATERQNGKAFVYERDLGGADAWGQAAWLVADDGAEGDKFGFRVDIDGNLVVVGSYLDDDLGIDSGSAYVFERNAGGPDEWGQVAKLTASDGAAGHWFGASVTISGDTLLVGADQAEFDGVKSGAVYVFERDAGGSNAWGPVAKIQPHDGESDQRFGVSVSLDGDTAAIGASTDSDVLSESVYIYERDVGGPDAWGWVTRITAADGEPDDSFGLAVALVDDILIVGAAVDDDFVDRSSGSAYVFQRNLGGPNVWGQVAKLHASDPDRDDLFGRDVAFDGEIALISATGDNNGGSFAAGSAYLFKRTDAEVSVSGACPGEVTLEISGLVPHGMARVLSAAESGPNVLPPPSPCEGTEVNLDDGGPLLTGVADGDGKLSIQRTFPEGRCGLYVQAVDRTSCSVSEVVRVP